MATLASAGNTYNPCLLLLTEKGYELSLDDGGGWYARLGSLSFAATNPPELLGIVILWERFGPDWNRQSPNILDKLLKA